MPKDDVLGRIEIAAPCSVSWETMSGDERARFCGSCSKHVYNLSAMSKPEAEKLVLDTEGRICVRFFKRQDGTVITDNCPVGVRALRRHFSVVYGAVAAGFAMLLGLPFAANSQNQVLQGKPMMGEPMMGAPAPITRQATKQAVYFVKKVKSGHAIKTEDLEVRNVAECKVSNDVVCDVKNLVGRKAKHNIVPGQIARTDDAK